MILKLYKIKFSILLLLLLIIGIVFTVHVSAYEYGGKKWTNASVTYLINNDWANLYGITAITSAALSWNQAGAAFTFVYGGTTNINTSYFGNENDAVNKNGYNIVGFQDTGNTGYIASTYIWSPENNPSIIIDVDTQFNTYYEFSNSGESNKYDVQNEMTHEFGHWLHLDHTQLSNCWPWLNESIAATMCSWTWVGNTWYRTLEPDDINGIKYIYPATISGSISQNTTWFQNRVYIIQGQVTVNSGITLTIEPGVVVKFQDTSSSLVVNGTLNATGTSQNKIYFTSIKDDTAGGDTNGDGSATSPGIYNWDNIRFNSGSSGSISNAVIHYGGWNNQGAIYNNGGTVNISFSEIANNYYYGIWQTSGTLSLNNSSVHDHGFSGIYQGNGSLTVSSSEIYNHSYGAYVVGGTASISGSNMHNNSSYGLYNATANTINAENNYWGAASGPYHPTLNPNGTGNAVSNNVDFDPWLAQWP